MGEQRRFTTVIMRGGSSKGVFLREAELPLGQAARERLILALFGSPDKRQIDGLGGADYLTSKCAIMGPPSRPDADIDYTFAQVSVVDPFVSFDVNCGNISAAAAVYAIEEGYVTAQAPLTLVRVHNTNTGKVLRIRVPVAGGAPLIEGDCEIDGVPGSGAEIEMDLSDTAGACTGALLPTGGPAFTLFVESLGRTVELSIVDVGNACVFVAAAELGVAGTELRGEFSEATLNQLDEIRRKSAALCNLTSEVLPLPVIVSAPQGYATMVPGRCIPEDGVDIVARQFLERMLHQAYAGTGAACLAAACKIEGTVPHRLCRRSDAKLVRIGHPSGVLPTQVAVTRDGGGWTVRQVLFARTARRLMDGTAYVRESLLT